MGAEPVEPPLTGPERAMLEGWLDYHRAHADLIRGLIDGTVSS